MTTTNIEELLRQKIGLDPTATGRSAIVNAVRVRMARCGVTDTGEYWELLRVSVEELQQLVEEVVVPETWFFRDRETFVALVRLVADEWLPTHPTGMLRLLSLPCSTGEEPYSIAMALLEAGLPPERFAVDGMDISDRALKVARQASYGRNSFRGKDLGFRGRFFSPVSDRFHLADSVRKQVQFQRANLLSLGLKMRTGFYDFVFCRNTLIYFDRAAQDQAIRVLSQLLTPEGILFVGHAEAFLVAARGFRPAGHAMSATFRKVAHSREGTSAVVPPQAKRITRARVNTRLVRKSKQQVPSEPICATPALPVDGTADLETAARLANGGHLTEAAEICENHLRVHGPSAAAYHLLGLAHDAKGDKDQAAECYRRAIYLDPTYADALLHLAFLAEKEGNVALGRRLRQRARRAEDIST